jgi:sec-independent protein translocase protein TatB
MFGVSMWEIAIVVIVLLALVGPGKIPELAKTVGKALGSFRRSVDEVKKEVNLEEELDFLRDVKDVSAYDVLAEDAPTNESVSLPAGPSKKQPVRSGRRKVRPGKKGLAQALFGGLKSGGRKPPTPSGPVGPSGGTPAENGSDAPAAGGASIKDGPGIAADGQRGLPTDSGDLRQGGGSDDPDGSTSSSPSRRLIKPGEPG